MTSALCCLACENILGYFLPPDPRDITPQYTCNVCEYKIPESLAVKASQELVEIVKEFTMFDLVEQLEFLDNLLTKFHEHHSLVLHLKMNICRELGKNLNDTFPSSIENHNEKKIILCEEILTVLDIIEPGLTVNRGVLLYELADALLQREKGKLDATNNNNLVHTCEKYLYEASKCLEHEVEPKTVAIHTNVVRLQNSIL